VPEGTLSARADAVVEGTTAGDAASDAAAAGARTVSVALALFADDDGSVRCHREAPRIFARRDCARCFRSSRRNDRQGLVHIQPTTCGPADGFQGES